MTIGSSPIASRPIAGAGGASGAGPQTIYPVSIPSAEAVGIPSLLVSQTIILTEGIPAPSFSITVEIMADSYITVPSLGDTSSVGVPTIQKAGASLPLPTFSAWSPVVLLDGVDVSAKLTGEVVVEGEEGAARVADVVLSLAAGTAVNLPAYVGKSVSIDFAEADGSNAVRLFTGVVDLPNFDYQSGTLHLRCTDDLQGVVAALTRPAIDALLVSGIYSPAVFDETADNWQYAADRAATVAGNIDLSPLRTARFVSWVPASSADYAFTGSDVLYDESVQVELANRDQIKNRIIVDFKHRFPRCKKRAVSIDYSIDGSEMLFGDFLAAGRWMLPREAVRSAVVGTGWRISGAITFDAIPASGSYPVTGSETPLVWVNSPEMSSSLCMGFDCLLTRAYTQTITESYTFTVENAASVAAMGARPETRQNAMEASFDNSAWETVANGQPAGGGSFAAANAEPEIADPLPGEEAAVDHFPTDKTDRAAAALAMRTMIAAAQVAIYASHRQSAVIFTVPLVPGLDTDKTVQVTASGVNARGKVRSVIHRMNLDTGKATSSVNLAICSLQGLGYSHPAAEAIPPEPPEALVPSAPDYAVSVSYANTASAEHTLAITLPGIDAESRDHYAPTVEETISAMIFEDLFEVTA